MAEMKTNRELYSFVSALAKRLSESTLTLESYLENMRRLARAYGQPMALSLSEFACLLEASCETSAREAHVPSTQVEDYQAWDGRIARQLEDLRELRQAGSLEDKYRYFGIDAPSGARWYNFDPNTYLECGMAGTFGGWEEGDDTGRCYVPGKVAVLDATGGMTAA